MNYLYHKSQQTWKMFLQFTVIIIVLVFLFNKILYKNEIECYRWKKESLPNITDFNPKKGKSIFFLETSCISAFKEKIVMSPRQACAVESAAILNPNMEIYVLYTSPAVFKFEGEESDEVLKILLKYENVKILHLDYGEYIKDSPVEELYTSGRIENSKFALSRASDVLRYLTLWKYGGIYLDMDVIILKSLEDLPPNFTGLKTEKQGEDGVMGFDAYGQGHEMVESCLYDLKEHFNRRNSSRNGFGILTRLLRRICNVPPTNKTDNILSLIDFVKEDRCNGFKVYPPNIFYPIGYTDWYLYFNQNSTNYINTLKNDSKALHFWNKYSNRIKIPITSQVPYLYFARKYCPKVVSACKEYF